MVIIIYVLFAVININNSENFASALIFEIIGFLILVYIILGNIFSNSIKIGYYIPLVMVTVIYTIILDIINIACITTIGSKFFILIHLALFFVYCLFFIPMYLMGRR